MLSEADKDEIREVIRQYLIDNLTLVADVSVPVGDEYGPSGPRSDVELSLRLPIVIPHDPNQPAWFPVEVSELVCQVTLRLDGAGVEVDSLPEDFLPPGARP